MALLHSILSLGAALGRVDDYYSGVYLVVERGDGSKSRPYDGEVVDCMSEGATVEFQNAFKDAWWQARRPALGPSPVLRRGGCGSRRGTSSGSAAGAGVRAGDGHGVITGPDGSPPFTLHGLEVLLKSKATAPGTRTLTSGMVKDVLQSLGLSTINQMTTARVKNVFKRISASIAAHRKGLAQWTWPQACPVELLTNYWRTEEGNEEDRSTIHAGSLYPPWHNVVKATFAERRLAVIVAAWLNDYWMYNLCVELKVEWKANFRSKFGSGKAAATALAPLKKKRGRLQDLQASKSPKKKRCAAPPTGATTPEDGKGSNEGSSGAGSSSDASGSAGSQENTRLLSLVLQDAEGCSLRDLADSKDVPAVDITDSSVIENVSVGHDERAASLVVRQSQSMLLPYEMVVKCMQHFSTNVDDTATTSSDAVVKVNCSSIPPTTFTRAAVMDMLSVHTFNRDVLMLKKSFAWLSELAASMDFFPEGLGTIFSPSASVAAVAWDVYDLLSNRRIGDVAWRFFDESAGANGAEAGDRAYGGHTVRIRELAGSCQSSWLTSAMINVSMIELRLATRSKGCYTLLTEQVASLLRIGGEKVTVEAAQTAATEVAAEVGASLWLGMVVNLCNAHWVSMVVNINGREVHVYDSLPGVRDTEMALATERIILLCDAVVDQQAAATGGRPRASQPWKMTRSVGPTQADGHSCGVYAVANVVCALAGIPFRSAPRADLLRLALVHHILSRGRRYDSVRLVHGVVSAPHTGGAAATA